MTAPGIGALAALSYTSMIEDPANFKNSGALGAYAGLAARGYQSGEIDHDGHNSRRGDKRVRSLLYEAAILVLTRVRSESAPRGSGLKPKERAGRAVVAVARKLGP
ncbi:MAG: transposase [Roseiarcus sp.]